MGDFDLGLLTKIATGRLNVPLGITHGPGAIPVDLDRDGHTDVLFAPSQFDTGVEQPLTPVVSSGGVIRVDSSKTSALKPGVLRDWVIADFTGDGRVDVAFVDHGLELPPALGGFQNGFNYLLVASDGGLTDRGGISMPRSFYHSLAAGDLDGDGDLDLVIQSFVDVPTSILINNGGRFTSGPAIPFDDPKFMAPGTVSVLNTTTGPLIVAASYVTDGGGTVQGFKYSGGAVTKAFSIPLPMASDLGVYQIIAGDFRGVGIDDIILVAEAVSDPQRKQWFYLKAEDGKYVDATAQRLGGINPGYNLPSKFVDFDVNGDGRLDIIGFSWDSNAAKENRLIWLNAGDHFVRANTADLFPTTGIVIPQFKTDSAGRWTSLEGFFQVVGDQWVTKTQTEVEIAQFALPDPSVLGPVQPSFAYEARLAMAYQNIMRGSISGAQGELTGTMKAVSNSVMSGQMMFSKAVEAVVQAAGFTTSVALLSYQFFTGKAPGEGGIDYLVSPTGPNPNNLNSAYYAKFNLENRYINFAMNLGREGDGKAWFDANYGSRDIYATASEAYRVIFGTAADAAKAHDLVDPRLDFFKSFSGETEVGQGTKAALVGWLIAEAVKADVGAYAEANNAFLRDLADGAAFGVDLVGISVG